jgi:predicted O-linked N-acetylglucosamine transferase (SPINDLY family)
VDARTSRRDVGAPGVGDAARSGGSATPTPNLPLDPKTPRALPVLTCVGDRWAARTSASLLRAANLAWVAGDEDDLVVKASAMARDPATSASLAALRAGMRARLAASAACDTAGLCLALEQIYRQLRV